MTQPSPVRRAAIASVALGTLLGSALGALLLAPAPASAAPWAGTYSTATVFDYTGAGCSASSPGTPAVAVPMASNATVPFSLTGSSTGTGPTAGDTATMSAAVAGSARIGEAAGGVTDFDVAAHLTANVHRALGAASACNVNANSATTVMGTFSTATAGLLDLDLTNRGTGWSNINLNVIRIGPNPPSSVFEGDFNQLGSTHRLLTVQPGDWQINVNFVSGASEATVPGSIGSASDITSHVHGVFRPFGVADGAATGSAAKYLTLPDGQTCASHSVTAGFTAKAGKKPKHGKKPVIKKATFFVDGAKVKSVKKPNKKTTVPVSGLPSSDVTTVSAELKLTGKGTVTVERTYLPCQ